MMHGKAKYAKFCQSWPKWCKNVQKRPPFAYITLVLVSFWPHFEVWKYPVWMLSVFMRYFEGLHGFWSLLTFFFYGFLSHFWPHLGPHEASLNHFGTKMGTKLGHLGVTWWWFWHRFGIIFWGRFDVVLTPFKDFSGPFFCAFWANFCPFSRSYCVFLVMFW